jgi:hypothetical protein
LLDPTELTEVEAWQRTDSARELGETHARLFSQSSPASDARSAAANRERGALPGRDRTRKRRSVGGHGT